MYKYQQIQQYYRSCIQLLCAALLLLAGCKKDEEPVVKAKQVIKEYVTGDPQLSLFKTALQHAGMWDDTSFTNSVPYTVFAPVDSAFIAAGLTAEKINNYDPKQLANILRYHIVYGRLSGSSLVGFYTQDVLSEHAVYRPTVARNYYGIFFNGIPLVQGNIELGDGVIHKLARVAFPPAGNLWQVIQQDPDLTFYAAAIERINYTGNLNFTPPIQVYQFYYWNLTVLAPNNEAFKAFGFANVAAVQQADPDVLKNFITYGILHDTYYTATFMGGARLGTPVFDLNAIPAKYYYIMEDGFTFRTSHNVTPPHIIRPDIVATNGVVQVVDQVIIP